MNENLGLRNNRFSFGQSESCRQLQRDFAVYYLVVDNGAASAADVFNGTSTRFG